MQLRDAGKLDLEDTLDRHVDGAAYTPTHPPAALARVGPAARDARRLVADACASRSRTSCSRRSPQAELVLPSGARFHYSNLAFALLGHRRRARLGRAVRGLRPRAAARAGRPDARDASSRSSRRRRATSRSRTPTASGRRSASRPARWASAGQLWGTAPTSAAGARSSPIPTSPCSRRRAPRRCARCR